MAHAQTNSPPDLLLAKIESNALCLPRSATPFQVYVQITSSSLDVIGNCDAQNGCQVLQFGRPQENGGLFLSRTGRNPQDLRQFAV